MKPWRRRNREHRTKPADMLPAITEAEARQAIKGGTRGWSRGEATMSDREYATGGPIQGAGAPDDDSIPVWLLGGCCSLERDRTEHDGDDEQRE